MIKIRLLLIMIRRWYHMFFNGFSCVTNRLDNYHLLITIAQSMGRVAQLYPKSAPFDYPLELKSRNHRWRLVDDSDDDVLEWSYQTWWMFCSIQFAKYPRSSIWFSTTWRWYTLIVILKIDCHLVAYDWSLITDQWSGDIESLVELWNLGVSHIFPGEDCSKQGFDMKRFNLWVAIIFGCKHSWSG